MHGAPGRAEVIARIERLVGALRAAIWNQPADALSGVKGTLVRLVRLLVVLVRDITIGQLTLRAMSLVYTTLLSFVPLLALSFSVLKAFDVHNQIEPMLSNFLEPLGEKGVELTGRIVQFIEGMNVGVLGAAGLALLIYTAISLLQKIEESFNFIWHVSRPRTFGQRFSSYLSVLLVGPLLVFSAIGITAAAAEVGVVRSVLEVEPVGHVADQLGRLVPYVLVVGAFAFVYAFMPNTSVQIQAALVGALVGGVLWQTAGWVFATFVASSTHYAAIYSGFAVLILFMIWLYLSWLILLLGASVSFYVQHPEYMTTPAGKPRMSSRVREHLALLVMTRIGRLHLEGRAPLTLPQLAAELGVPAHAAETVVAVLKSGGIVAETSDDPPAYLPARDIDELPARDVLDVVRTAGEGEFLKPADLPAPPAVDEVLAGIDQAIDASVLGVTVRTLVEREGGGPAQR